MVKLKDIDDLVYWCWEGHSNIERLNDAIRAENESRLYSAYDVCSPMRSHAQVKDAVYSLEKLPGEPEKIEEVRGKLTTACNAGLYFSLGLMNSHLALHDVHSLNEMSESASKYADCLKKLGFDVPKEALYIDSKIQKQSERLNESSVQRETEKWLVSWINRDRATELKAAIIDLYNSFIAVNEDAVCYADAVSKACETVRRQPGEGIDANELEDMLSNVEMYLSANSAIHTMISNAQKSLEGKDWYQQEFEPVEKPAWAKKLS